ncbi:MAG: hypothetical protein ABIX01_16280 [Chitinophagaceae bacterium]
MKLPWLICISILLSCRQENRIPIKQGNAAVNPLPTSRKVRPGYDRMKSAVQLRKKLLQKRYPGDLNTSSIIELQKEFVAILVDSILPYWYGTPWDFNGTTQKPGEGSIACGYFITTVLQDCGLPIRRVKMAQCASQELVYDLVKKNPGKIFRNDSLAHFIDYIKSQGFGVYVVGLDSHVGFLYHDGSEVYFIHAKWVNPKAVLKEVAAQSSVLYYSSYRVVGKISDDEMFLKRWLQGQ